MSDLGITPEMFTEACSQTGKMAEEHEVCVLKLSTVWLGMHIYAQLMSLSGSQPTYV